MLEEKKGEQVFTVKRLCPDDVNRLLKAYWKKRTNLATKSYNVTSDSQRFELVRLVLSKEMTIKKVMCFK